MLVVAEEIRKGPWTEQEDVQLMCFVRLFGERRWDFIAKFSGLNRTGKSCRLRWVNYLHPGLKRGRMTPQEERTVLELHSRWGNRWSRIARRLPGRTDNEIKNYWRTHMRKKAQERKKSAFSPLLPSSATSSNSPPLQDSSNTISGVSLPDESQRIIEGSLLMNIDDDKGDLVVSTGDHHQSEEEVGKGYYYSMDQIWKEIALMEEDVISSISSTGPVHVGNEEHKGEDAAYTFLTPPIPMAPPSSSSSASSWNINYCSDSLWRMDDQEDIKMPLPTMGDYFVSDYGNGIEY
ncbi:transcription factor MYB59-like [Telopea speciosissima]|uniref:transcription factor MYB59-like n=1 Tax=Telopea speciosissima TaxID=54955 RepID=UPI001CC56E1E|nr:transcription factor MYB59-like [Telopea speciosissima]